MQLNHSPVQLYNTELFSLKPFGKNLQRLQMFDMVYVKMSRFETI